MFRADANVLLNNNVKTPTLERAIGVVAVVKYINGEILTDIPINDNLQPTSPFIPRAKDQNVVVVSAINVTGDTLVGATLTATPTPSNATGNYQWQVSNNGTEGWTDISGTTSSTYEIIPEYAFKYIRVKITGTGIYTGNLISDAAGQIQESTDASLVSVLGQTDADPAGNGETSGTPITWNINVANAVESLKINDIEVAIGARASMYSDAAFSANSIETIYLIANGSTIAYIKVTAQDTSARYYIVTINRAGEPDKEIVAIAPITDINVTYGTALGSIGLPHTVEVTLDDNSTKNLTVTWDNGTPTYNRNIAGTYTLEATITMIAGIANEAGHRASVNVIVEAAPDTALNINSGPINISEPGDYIIIGTGEPTSNTIKVAKEVAANITLTNVNIDVSNTENSTAFLIEDNSTGNVTITLVGDNILKSGFSQAAIQKNGNGADIGTLTIKGTGSLTANGGSNGAGIGGSLDHSSSHIIINSGVITTTGGSKVGTSGGGGSGIGGGNRGIGGSYITINGGTVTANGGSGGNYDAAGIGGGGWGGDGMHINITGGTVTANGSTHGAGIGGGYGGNGSYITISGGTVVANGGGLSAGIGGGFAASGSSGGNGTNINISGGIVTATSHSAAANGGAGIGGGDHGDGNNITISGGVITATGGWGSDGIGGGREGRAENNKIAPAEGIQISVYVGSEATGTLLGTYITTNYYTRKDKYFYS